MASEQDQRSATLDQELYKPPPGCVKRERFKHKETGHDFRYDIRTENERIAKVVQFNKLKDHAERNMEMIHYPKWKIDKQMKRGKSSTDFQHYRNNFGLQTETAWKQFPLRENKEDFDPYVDGLDKIGNEFALRKRIKENEVFYSDF